MLHYFMTIWTSLNDAVPLIALYIVAGVLALLFLFIIICGLCCCQPKKGKGGYEALSGDEDDDDDWDRRGGQSVAPSEANLTRMISPFDALHLKSSNVQPLDDTDSLIPDPTADYGINMASVYPPALSAHEMLSTASLPAKFHRIDEPIQDCLDSRTGFVVVTFNFRPNSKKMFLFVESAQELPDSERAGYSKIQIRMALLPGKKQRFKTKWISNVVERRKRVNDEDDEDDEYEDDHEVDLIRKNPKFRQPFTCRDIAPEDVTNYGIRVRVYASSSTQKEKLLGECVRSFGAVNLEEETTERLILEPRSAFAAGETANVIRRKTAYGINNEDGGGGGAGSSASGDIDGRSLAETINIGLRNARGIGGSAPLLPHRGRKGGRQTPAAAAAMAAADAPSSSATLPRRIQHGGGLPELQVSLAYFDLTGRIACEVIRGSRFHDRGNSATPPDTFVRLSVLSERGKEMDKSKTSVRKKQPAPIYRENFLFPIPSFQLAEVTLVFSVYSKKGFRKKELLGWCAAGKFSSGQEGRLHWKEMIEGKGEVVSRWHVLLETS